MLFLEMILGLIFLIGTTYVVVQVMMWVDEFRAWRRRRIEAAVDRKQAELRATILPLTNHLDLGAHEARKALIRESFLASGMVPPRD